MGRFSVTYVLVVLCVVRKHHLVKAPGPGLTVVFLTFLMLAQRGGFTPYSLYVNFQCGPFCWGNSSTTLHRCAPSVRTVCSRGTVHGGGGFSSPSA